MVDKKDIAKAGAVSGASTVLPYVAVIGGGLLAYKYLKDNTPNFIGGVGGIAGGVKEIVKTTTDRVNDGLSGGGDTIINLFDNAKDEVSKDIDITKATTEGIADTILPGSDGIKTSSPLAPAASSLFNIGVVAGNSGFMGGGIGLGIAGALANTFGGYTNKSGKVSGINVSDIKTHAQAESMGLGLAPLAVNANPKIDEKAVSNKSTNKSLTAKQLKSSGMPASNLKNARSVSTMTDKTGKERIVVKYKNGVTLRY